mmetsp:Transcript_13555/g.32102  ORF Transcript_13555/g.32102 Transcript_13555/m.32102 type:complete len:220 (+) Transcript_13555:1368-2027(+)
MESGGVLRLPEPRGGSRRASRIQVRVHGGVRRLRFAHPLLGLLRLGSGPRDQRPFPRANTAPPLRRRRPKRRRLDKRHKRRRRLETARGDESTRGAGDGRCGWAPLTGSDCGAAQLCPPTLWPPDRPRRAQITGTGGGAVGQFTRVLKWGHKLLGRPEPERGHHHRPGVRKHRHKHTPRYRGLKAPDPGPSPKRPMSCISVFVCCAYHHPPSSSRICSF